MELILNTFGTTLTKDNGAFMIIHTDGRQSIPIEGLRSIQIGRGTQVTSDAILLAIEHEIDILFIENSGKPAGRVWSSKYGSISTIRRGQLDFSFSADAIRWIKDMIVAKIENQQALLLSMSPSNERTSNIVANAINKLEDYRSKVNTLQGEVIPDIAASLRGWEGAASKLYFDALNLFLPEGYRFSGRSQHPATDLINCLLNYAYGILYGKIEGALIKAGIDPYVGIFHRDDYNRPVLVFDVIEKYRVWADYVIITLALQQVINDDSYQIKDDGSYWLENLGKRIVIQSINDYLDEVIPVKGNERSRLTHIQFYAHELASLFKKYV